MHNISLAIPDDIVFEIKSFPKMEAAFQDKLQLSLAIGMFVSQEISLAKAAQLAGKSLAGFMDVLLSLGIPSLNYTEDMLNDDLKFANKE